MIIDIGGGTSEIAVIALGGITTSTSVKIAGDRFNSDIIDYMRKKHNIAIGVATAEQIKINVGSAIEDLENPPADYEVYGRDLLQGIPVAVKVSYREIVPLRLPHARRHPHLGPLARPPAILPRLPPARR